MLARRLIAVPAVGTSVVRRGERTDDELPRLYGFTALPTSSTMPQYSWPIGVGCVMAFAPRYGHRSDPQTHVTDVLTMASVGSTIWAKGAVQIAHRVAHKGLFLARVHSLHLRYGQTGDLRRPPGEQDLVNTIHECFGMISRHCRPLSWSQRSAASRAPRNAWAFLRPRSATRCAGLKKELACACSRERRAASRRRMLESAFWRGCVQRLWMCGKHWTRSQG